MEKKLYKGRFNWHGEIHTLHRRATNPIHATHIMFMALSDILKREPHVIQHYFNGNKDNILVEEVKE